MNGRMATKETIEAEEAKKALKKERIIKDEGPRKIIDYRIKNMIKSHAKSTSKEIYGWLVGRESERGDIYVFSALACQRYTKQNYIGAAPDPREIQELGSNLPQGIGMVGIYHSHPAEIFHSSIDDKTLQNMARMYPKMLSAVSNADAFEDAKLNQTRWFQLNPETKTTDEIKVEFTHIPKKKFRVISVFGNLSLNIQVPKEGKVAQQAVREIINNYEKVWDQVYSEKIRLSDRMMEESQLWPIKSVEDIIKEYKLSISKSESISELKNKNKDYFNHPKNLYRFKMKFSNVIEEKNREKVSGKKESDSKILIKGQIPLLAINIFDNDKKDLSMEEILQKIKMEFQDDIIQKLSRSILIPRKRETGKDNLDTYYLKLVVSTPLFLPYPGIPLKFNILLRNVDDLKQKLSRANKSYLQEISLLDESNLQNADNFIEMDTNILESFAKRARVVAMAGYHENAIQLLDKIREIYKIRGQKREKEKIQTMMNIVKNL